MPVQTPPAQSAFWHCAARLHAPPTGSVGVQTSSLEQKVPSVQSPSVVQAGVPQVLSLVKQAPDTHTRSATAGVQVATLAGIDGSGAPLATLGWHIPAAPGAASHHWPEVQSASVTQPDTQSPVLVLQALPVWPSQSELAVHLPQWPDIAPERKQKGSPAEAQGSLAVNPESPLQGTQVNEVLSQIGSSLGQVAEERHCTQVLVVALQVGALGGHCESITQPTQRPALVPLVAQMPERHTWGPSPAVQGPSPLA